MTFTKASVQELFAALNVQQELTQETYTEAEFLPMLPWQQGHMEVSNILVQWLTGKSTGMLLAVANAQMSMNNEIGNICTILEDALNTGVHARRAKVELGLKTLKAKAREMISSLFETQLSPIAELPRVEDKNVHSYPLVRLLRLLYHPDWFPGSHPATAALKDIHAIVDLRDLSVVIADHNGQQLLLEALECIADSAPVKDMNPNRVPPSKPAEPAPEPSRIIIPR